MQCYVYKGTRKEGAYLYINKENDFSDVPEPLLESMGKLSLALSFDLHPERKLAQADPAIVRADLEKQGYHLQVPPPQHSLLKQLPNSQPPE